MKNILFKILILIIVIPFLILIFQSVIVRYNYYFVFPDKINIYSFVRLLKQDTIKLLFSSLIIGLISTIIAIVISYPVARYLAFNKINTTIYVTILLPILIPPFVYYFGILNVLNKFGFQNTYIGVIISHMIIMLPYAIINISNDLKIVGTKYEEVAMTMGAGNKKILFDITFPLIKNTLINTFALLLIISFSQYFLTIMIGGGKIKTYTTFIFPLIQGNDRNVSSNAILLYAIINLVLYYMIIQKGKNEKN